MCAVAPACPHVTKEYRMQIPTDITFLGLEHSDPVEASVHRWVARLEHVYDRIEKCSVTISQPHKRHRHGHEFHVSIRLDLPGPNIAVSHVGHVDAYVSIADAFRAARRQLLDQIDVQRGFVKTHVVERTGHIGANINKHRADLR
jgi:ribosome-associated translation inhibitor RaiA